MIDVMGLRSRQQQNSSEASRVNGMACGVFFKNNV